MSSRKYEYSDDETTTRLIPPGEFNQIAPDEYETVHLKALIGGNRIYQYTFTEFSDTISLYLIDPYTDGISEESIGKVYCYGRLNEIYVTKFDFITGETVYNSDGSKQGSLAGAGTSYNFVFIENEGH